MQGNVLKLCVFTTNIHLVSGLDSNKTESHFLNVLFQLVFCPDCKVGKNTISPFSGCCHFLRPPIVTSQGAEILQTHWMFSFQASSG